MLQNTLTASDKLNKLSQEVFKIRTVMGETYDKSKDYSLLEFTKQQYDLPNLEIPEDKRKDVIGVITSHIQSLLGDDVGRSVKEQLEENYSVITSDHHGPITHPDFVNSNLLNSFAFQEMSSARMKNLIILSVANVSFDNFSFPRGHLFHSKFNKEVVQNKLPFFGYKVHSYSVFNFPPYDSEILRQMKRRLDTWVGQTVITRNEKQILTDFVDDVYGRLEPLSMHSFSDQMTEANYYLWKKLFSREDKAPSLLYIEIEKIVMELLLKFHIHEDTVISKILFDDTFHELLLKHFDGITAAFSTENNSGTFLFWGMPKDQKYRLSLWKKGDSLVSVDGSYSIKLTPEAIERALINKELMPSTLLSFILLSFYYGLVLIGGGGQTTYLTKMKEAYLNLLKDSNLVEEIQLVEGISTNRLSFPYPSISFLEGEDKELIPTTSLDLWLYGKADTIPKIREMAKKITFGQGLLREIPGLYRMLVSEDKQNEDLLSITAKEVDEFTGFSDVISPTIETG